MLFTVRRTDTRRSNCPPLYQDTAIDGECIWSILVQVVGSTCLAYVNIKVCSGRLGAKVVEEGR